MNPHEIIAEYYCCYRERNLEALRAILTADFRHTSSFGEYSGRDAMLAEIWPAVGQSWACDLQTSAAGRSSWRASWCQMAEDQVRTSDLAEAEVRQF